MGFNQKTFCYLTLPIALFALLLCFDHGSASDAVESCLHCGMKKNQYAHSWVVIEHDDGSREEVCSIHCAAIDMAIHVDRNVTRITAGDYNGFKQIDAEKAFWVIGGDRPGVMTKRAKWAFETKADADRFIMAHGGQRATFGEVMRAAFDDMYEDTLMRKKRSKLMQLRDAGSEDRDPPAQAPAN